MPHKIAVITTEEYGCYECSSGRVIDTITDWAEVTDEEYEILRKAQHKMGFSLLEQPVDTPEFVRSTIESYLLKIKLEESREKKRKQDEDRKSQERKAKREAKSLEQKRIMLESLKKELGEK